MTGKDGVPARVIRCANASASPTNRYTIDPRDLIRAFREIDDRGEELVAIYHSHPQSPALPSPTDRADSEDDRGLPRYPGVVYVLVTLMAEPPEIRAFRIDHRAMTELVLV
jgi:[CysO sulfur-carrier protein]-S-L-cysteine hydrolase